MAVKYGLKTILMEKELHLVLVFHLINSNLKVDKIDASATIGL
jgi:hypothetical protein